MPPEFAAIISYIWQTYFKLLRDIICELYIAMLYNILSYHYVNDSFTGYAPPGYLMMPRFGDARCI